MPIEPEVLLDLSEPLQLVLAAVAGTRQNGRKFPLLYEAYEVLGTYLDELVDLELYSNTPRNDAEITGRVVAIAAVALMLLVDAKLMEQPPAQLPRANGAGVVKAGPDPDALIILEEEEGPRNGR